MKTYYEAMSEGKCQNCEREPLLCKEEDLCLKCRKCYALIVYFYKNTICFETYNKEELDVMINNLESAFKENLSVININNYWLCTEKITLWKTEEYYG